MAFLNTNIFRGVWLFAVAIAVAGTAFAGFRDERQPAPVAADVKGQEQAKGVPEKAPAAPIKKRTWSLDAKKSLRDNLDDWTREAGWKPIVWDASNPWEVRLLSDSIEGEFPEVLKQISTATRLNICATSRDKYVRVTDRGVSCKMNNN